MTLSPYSTMGDLEEAIVTDSSLGYGERRNALAALRALSPRYNDSTPLSQIISGIGGGVLGLVIARYLRLGGVGQAIATATGYGIGSAVHGFASQLGGSGPTHREATYSPGRGMRPI